MIDPITLIARLDPAFTILWNDKEQPPSEIKIVADLRQALIEQTARADQAEGLATDGFACEFVDHVADVERRIKKMIQGGKINEADKPGP